MSDDELDIVLRLRLTQQRMCNTAADEIVLLRGQLAAALDQVGRYEKAVEVLAAQLDNPESS